MPVKYHVMKAETSSESDVKQEQTDPTFFVEVVSFSIRLIRRSWSEVNGEGVVFLLGGFSLLGGLSL